MPATNDAIHTKLSAYSGNTNDKIAAWLAANGASGSSLMDLWMDYLSAYSGSFNDRLKAWLAAQGASGSTVKDLWNDYWVNIHI